MPFEGNGDKRPSKRRHPKRARHWKSRSFSENLQTLDRGPPNPAYGGSFTVCAGVVGLTPEKFRERFGYVVEHETRKEGSALFNSILQIRLCWISWPG